MSNESTINETETVEITNNPLIFNQKTLISQILTNLNGMVMVFVRTMFQDKREPIGLVKWRWNHLL